MNQENPIAARHTVSTDQRRPYSAQPDRLPRSIVLLMDNDVPETAMRSVRYQNEGFVAITAFRCDEALEICKHLPVALAVLDVEMSGDDGLELAHKIRSLGRSISIVMYSGEQEVEWQGVADAFLEKGSDPSQLVDISRKLVLQTQHERPDRRSVTLTIDTNLTV